MIKEIKLNKDEVALKDFCTQLSISQATGKNWIKLGKVETKKKNNIIYFDQRYIDKLKKEISSDANKTLKNRRNKKFVSGNNYYKAYVGDGSKNLKNVERIIEYIKTNDVIITNTLIRCIINEYAIQSFFQKLNSGKKISNAYYKFLDKKIDIKKYTNIFIISDKEKKEHLKIIKDNPDIFLNQFELEIEKDIMGLIYISLKNIGNRKATGTYYTPEKIVENLNNKLFEKEKINEKKILDPCCGTGNFLLKLPKEIVFNQIYAMDIDKESVYITRLNVAIKYSIDNKKELDSHIVVCDFLKVNVSKKYDFIIGNPPWGYDFSADEKEYMTKNYYSAYGNNIESFDLFIEKSKSLLNENGYISFVVPEALLNVKSHNRIREIILNNFDIKYLEYLGDAFDGVQCPSIIIILKLTNRKISTKNLEIKNNKANFKIKTEREVTPDYFSFIMNDYEYKIIKQIDALAEKFFLKNNAIFALGIVTGNNSKYISSKKTDGKEMIIRGKDIYKYRYKEAEEYIDFKPTQFQQVAPVEYYRATPKLFYRFISNKLVFAYVDKRVLSLNSGNILIPTIKGVNIKYILAILNSLVIQFYFDKKFRSIKILRSHIESIPIPVITKENEKMIINKVDKLIGAESNKEIERIYESLNNEIANLYKITKEDYKYIKEQYEKEETFLYIK